MVADLRETERPPYEALQLVQLVVEDDSARHAGHVGAASGGGHYSVEIASAAFTGKNRLTRHRIVHDALHTLWPAATHALVIRAVVPEEDT